MRAVNATDALAAHIHGYAETSAIVRLLTADLGSVRAVAKGAMRVSNSFRGPLDKCVLYRVRLARHGSEGLFHLHSASVREAFPALRRDPPRFLAAALALEVAGDLMRENEPHEELFRLTVFSLKVLDRAPRERLGLVATFFLARAVAISGHVPEIGHCVACGRALAADERPLISAQRGGVLHLSCGQGEPGARMLAPETLSLLDRLWRDPAAGLLRTDVAPVRLGELRRLLEDWLEHVLERRFRAVQPLEHEIARAPA
ncbi:MAG: DNA repair protein RecO [Planctomycetota bacterium]|jgi:DNA repair protein RecO (recombination protein O)